MTSNDGHIELLAPAGNFKALQAAVCGGANAVYLGLDHFNARRGADNFNLKNLKSACDYAHLRGVKIYLTLNIVVFESEFNTAMQMAYDAANAGVDAFIVQDLGVASAIVREIPHVPLHISTQMNIHDEAGLRAVAALGAARVCLGRECSLDTINRLCELGSELNVEIETFGHGALCICYSGQCLMSSMIGGRSANRGTCAQACRLNYELHEGRAALGSRRNDEDEKRGEYLLSPKDLCTIEILPKLKTSGVSALKIEGRMKSADYVFEVSNVYRNALDRLQKNSEDYQVTQKEMKRLQEAFSRGFTTAYMEGKRGNVIMSYKRPNNRGVNIGRVSGVSSKKIYIDTKQNLAMGDVLEIWTKRGRSTIKVDKTTKLKDSGAEFQINGRDFSLRNVRKSDRVFRVKSSEGTFSATEFQPKVPVDCKVELNIGSPSKIVLKNLNYEAELRGEIVEEARTKAVTKEEVKEHICRLGQTPFKIQNIEIDLDENVGIGFSILHHLRADALNLLEQKILQTDKPQLPKRKPNKNIKNNISKHDPIVVKSDVLFASTTYCDKLGDVHRNISNGEAFEVGPHLPVANVEAVYYFKKLGAKRIWLSPELSINQIKEITKHFPDMSFGLFIMGPQELMITRHCILMSEGPCDQNCKKCKRRTKDHYLLDRKGYEFPVTTDATGRSHIFNSVSLDVCHALDELKAAGIDSFLVDTTLMSASEAEAAFSRAQQALTSGVEKSQNTTTGHLFRKVL
ncbi:MAG: U32 family peptidase [Coriobacteriia bacterium]|nr:U32 family peptidase [Coriobacteriia bacterium]